MDILKIVCCITFWLYQKEYCTHEVYLDNVFFEHTTHLPDQYFKYFFMVPHLCTFVG